MTPAEIDNAVQAWNLVQSQGMTPRERDGMGAWLDSLEPAGHA